MVKRRSCWNRVGPSFSMTVVLLKGEFGHRHTQRDTHIYIVTQMWTHIYTDTHTHIHRWTYTYIHTDTCEHTYTHTYSHAHTHTQYTYTHIQTYTHTYTHLHMHTLITTYRCLWSVRLLHMHHLEHAASGAGKRDRLESHIWAFHASTQK